MSKLVAKWSADWRRTSVITDAAALAREAASLSTASVVPEFSGELVATGQQTAMRGNVPEALRIAKLANSLYPDSDGTNGLLGTLLILTGDAGTGEALARKAAGLNSKGYFWAANVPRVAPYFAH